jgi:hypothetical protein
MVIVDDATKYFSFLDLTLTHAHARWLSMRQGGLLVDTLMGACDVVVSIGIFQ